MLEDNKAVFFYNDTATTEIYTLSLHDALPIFRVDVHHGVGLYSGRRVTSMPRISRRVGAIAESATLAVDAKAKSLKARSEEHTSELQSRQYLVCRLLLEKKKNSYSLLPIA